MSEPLSRRKNVEPISDDVTTCFATYRTLGICAAFVSATYVLLAMTFAFVDYLDESPVDRKTKMAFWLIVPGQIAWSCVPAFAAIAACYVCVVTARGARALFGNVPDDSKESDERDEFVFKMSWTIVAVILFFLASLYVCAAIVLAVLDYNDATRYGDDESAATWLVRPGRVLAAVVPICAIAFLCIVTIRGARARRRLRLTS
jgi:hypothetical protein